jgi:hypothetical protein
MTALCLSSMAARNSEKALGPICPAVELDICKARRDELEMRSLVSVPPVLTFLNHFGVSFLTVFAFLKVLL